MRAIPFLVAGFCLAPVASATDADLLIYRVEEAGATPYESRILVTQDFLRMDEGMDPSASFTLFDRRSGVIYNLDPEDHTVVVIDPPRDPLPEPPIPLALSTQTVADPDLPSVAGVAPRHVVLQANGEVCSEVIAVPGVMNEAVAALAQFYERLARHHLRVVEAAPLELLDACDLADNVFAPRRPYEQGLPLNAWSAQSMRTLVSYEQAATADEVLFVVPEDYLRYEIDASPEGE